MTKKELRQLIRLRKQQHAADNNSADIIARLKENEYFSRARTIFIYNALPDEVQTLSLIDELILQGKTILLPRVVSDTEMELCRYTGRQDLQQGAMGIWEPVGEQFTDYGTIDVAVIPGMAFDRAGHRLGRGRGYYDRFLAQRSTRTLYKIGVCFPWQMVDGVPTDANDITMDCVIC